MPVVPLVPLVPEVPVVPLVPVVLARSEIGGFTLQIGRPWTPGVYVKKMIFRGGSDFASGCELWKELFDVFYSPRLQPKESDAWAVVCDSAVQKLSSELGIQRDLDFEQNINDSDKDWGDLEKLFKKIGKQLSSNKLNDKFIKTCESFFKWVLINKNEYFDHNHDLFHFPQKNQDVDKKIIRDQNNSNTLKYLKIRNRCDFSLNSDEVSNNHQLNNTNYCLFCHDRDKDSCSTKKYHWRLD